MSQAESGVNKYNNIGAEFAMYEAKARDLKEQSTEDGDINSNQDLIDSKLKQSPGKFGKSNQAVLDKLLGKGQEPKPSMASVGT